MKQALSYVSYEKLCRPKDWRGRIIILKRKLGEQEEIKARQ